MDKIKEVKKEVRVYNVSGKCPKCGGDLKTHDTVLTTYPPKFKYTCRECGAEFIATESYPYIEYKEIDEDDEYEFSIEFSSHLTNGGVIMTMYPNAKILDNGTGLIKSNDGTDQVCVEVKIDNNILYFNKDWWNSYYLKKEDQNV